MHASRAQTRDERQGTTALGRSPRARRVHPSSFILPPSPRTGATLTEVLMSLLIMSVGIVSVITIYPISLLRSIQATQLTNARLMRTNFAEQDRLTFTVTYPGDPAAAAGTELARTVSTQFDMLNHSTMPTAAGGIAPKNQQFFRGYWQPGTTYFVGQIVVPTPRDIISGSRSNRWYQCTVSGVSGPSEPHWERSPVFPIPNQTAVFDPPNGSAPVTWQALDTLNFADPPTLAAQTGVPYQPLPLTLGPGVTPEYDALNYVVDPLGWNTYANDATTSFLTPGDGAWNDFGFQVNNNIAARRPLAPSTRRLLRINGGAFNAAQGEMFASHPDNWNIEVTDTFAAVPALLSATGTFRPGLDLSQINFATGSRYRIVMTSVNDPRVVTKDIIALAGNVAAGFTVGWLGALPPGFLADGQVRIESYDRRYTWLATVNKNIQGDADVTMVVFSKRSLGVADEHAYTANSGTNGGMAFDSEFGLAWDATPAVAEPIPLVKEGNYLFDATNATWYRIVAVSNLVAPVNGVGSVTVTVDRPIPLSHQKAGGAGRVMLMRGIVEIFKL